MDYVICRITIIWKWNGRKEDSFRAIWSSEFELGLNSRDLNVFFVLMLWISSGDAGYRASEQ